MLWKAFEIASSCINASLPAFLEFLEAVLKRTYRNATAVLSWPSEWLGCEHSDGFSMLLSVVGIRKDRKGTILEEYGARGYTFI